MKGVDQLVTEDVFVTVKNPMTGQSMGPGKKVQVERTFYPRLYGEARRAELRQDAEQRRRKWQALTPKQQLEWLDRVNGKGLGATRQRARIAQALLQGDRKPKVEEKPTRTPDQRKADKKSRRDQRKPKHFAKKNERKQ